MPTYDEIDHLRDLITKDRAIMEWLAGRSMELGEKSIMLPGSPPLALPLDFVREALERYQASIRDELRYAGFHPPVVARDAG